MTAFAFQVPGAGSYTIRSEHPDYVTATRRYVLDSRCRIVSDTAVGGTGAPTPTPPPGRGNPEADGDAASRSTRGPPARPNRPSRRCRPRSPRVTAAQRRALAGRRVAPAGCVNALSAMCSAGWARLR
jgi:hypothetical protein